MWGSHARPVIPGQRPENARWPGSVRSPQALGGPAFHIIVVNVPVACLLYLFLRHVWVRRSLWNDGSPHVNSTGRGLFATSETHFTLLFVLLACTVALRARS